MSIYDFKAEKIDGGEVCLSEYRGKVILIVNTASKCGFTPQFADLEKLYQDFKDRGFVILGFPCNQFLEQDPEDNKNIHAFCKKNYGVTFPMFAKVEVNGPRALPLYEFLKEQLPFRGFDRAHPLTAKLDEILSQQDPGYAAGSDIKWNFTKFLIGRDGALTARFEPTVNMAHVKKAIEALL